MEEVCTDELIAYKAGFSAGRFDLLSQKEYNVENFEQILEEDSNFYSYGYVDAYEYYFQNYDRSILELETINERNEIMHNLFMKRISKYNETHEDNLVGVKFRV